jgi:hypothetical protein
MNCGSFGVVDWKWVWCTIHGEDCLGRKVRLSLPLLTQAKTSKPMTEMDAAAADPATTPLLTPSSGGVGIGFGIVDALKEAVGAGVG